ncbi:hypothetical protein BV22DRAFT_1100929, partial [Leucogyrophana mollusca]
MPSFLTKVFTRTKKQHDESSPTPTSPTLLDGKYEAVPALASNFAEESQSQPTSDSQSTPAGTPSPSPAFALSLFRPKSRVPHAQRRSDALPTLSLNLPGPKQPSDDPARAFAVVFEADPDAVRVLDDATIGARRLSPLEALILVRACAQAITERGLETLGIMHPHWYSASPDVQRKLISLFIHSLAPKTPITTLSPTPAAPTSAFDSELGYTRSPHDVAAVLRWGIRHLRLDAPSFAGATQDGDWGWYTAFHAAERAASYPPRAFSTLLVPALPPAHTALLTATIDVIAALAAHAEANSISGSKLSKFLGLWLLAPGASRAAPHDDWAAFYQRWERAGRVLEHLFLARIREESITHRLPTRLQELVQHYPYHSARPTDPTDDVDLLPRPRFSTRQHPALFVRVETHPGARVHPVRLVLEAFKLGALDGVQDEGDAEMRMWALVRAAASPTSPTSIEESSSPAATEESTSSAHPQPQPQLSRVFVDETIQLLSSIPAEHGAPALGLVSPVVRITSVEPSFDRKAGLGLGSSVGGLSGGGTASPTSPATGANAAGSPVITDWAQFSTSGFGDGASPVQPLAATLLDKDVEVTEPQAQAVSRKSSARRARGTLSPTLGSTLSTTYSPTYTTGTGTNFGTVTGAGFKSTGAGTGTKSDQRTDTQAPQMSLSSVRLVALDEAFVDFWADAVLDPISAAEPAWPPFVICGLRPVEGVVVPSTGANTANSGANTRATSPGAGGNTTGVGGNTSVNSGGNTRATSPGSGAAGATGANTGKPIQYLIIEQAPARAPSAPPTRASSPASGKKGRAGKGWRRAKDDKAKDDKDGKDGESKESKEGKERKSRTSSPRPSFRSDMTLAAARKRFSFFGGGGTVGGVRTSTAGE